MSLLKSINNKFHLRNQSTIIQLISNGYPSQLNVRSSSYTRNGIFNKRNFGDFIQKTEPNENHRIKNKEKFLDNIIKGKKKIKTYNENINKKKHKIIRRKKHSFEKLKMEFLLSQINNFSSQKINNSELHTEKNNKRKTNSEIIQLKKKKRNRNRNK